MAVIKKHKTDTDTGAWDAGANVKNAKSGEGPAYYGRILAWRDPEADETTKGAYKFPHHLVSADGEPGSASVRGCQSGIGVLNGAMGGADIPDGDRAGVYNHLSAHLEDADVEPADLRAEPMASPARPEGIERRALTLAELRVIDPEDADDRPRRIMGHAALFDVESEELGGFREVIHAGAFTKTISEADIRALQNHDSNRVLGRNTAGTLELAEDDEGLTFEIEPPGTTWADDLLVSMRRGDVDQMSFGFEAVRDRWETIGEDMREGLLRHIDEVRLYDISVVTFPAYPETSAEVRAQVREMHATTPAQGGHLGDGASDPAEGQGALDLLRRRVDLAERQ